METRVTRTRWNIGLAGLFLGGIIAAGLFACRPSALISVVRPAMVNVRQFGGTMSVGQFDGNHQAAAATNQDLRQRIVASEAGAVRLMEGGGGLVVHGSIMDYSYQEEVTSERTTCSSMVKQGEKMVRVERPCTRYHRLGKAHVAIAFNLTASATGQVIAAHTYEDSDRSSTHATDEQPAAINSGAMLEGLRSNITARFAKVILPWRETLRVVFGRCGDARGLCEAGAASVRAGDFESAISSFQSAIQQLEAAPERDNDDIAEAYWNRGIAREYSGDFPGAIADIVQASQLNPGHRTYPVELQNVRQMQAEQEQLRQQGVGEVGAEDVQEGGAP